MAAALLAHKNIEYVKVKSAGVYAVEGQSMSKHAQTTLAQRHISTAHASSQVNVEDVKWADVILTMTMRHKQLLVQSYPQDAHKINTLNEYVTGQTADVIDPYGGDLAMYEQTYEQLAATIDQLVMTLQKEAK